MHSPRCQFVTRLQRLHLWTVYLSLLCFLLFWGRITGKGKSITEWEAILHGPVTCCPLLVVATLPCLQKLHWKGSMALFGKSNWIEIQSLLDLDWESGTMRTLPVLLPFQGWLKAAFCCQQTAWCWRGEEDRGYLCYPGLAPWNKTPGLQKGPII